MHAVTAGRLPQVTVLGAMCKLQRPYRINRSIDAKMTHAPAPASASARTHIQLPQTRQELISDSQISSFVATGMLVVPSVVDTALVDDCLSVLNRQLGTPGAVMAGGAQSGLGKLQGSLTQHKAVRAVVTPTVLQALEDLISSCDTDNLTAQLALRFPQEELVGARAALLAGHGWHTDGLRRGRVHPFTILLGVALSDCDAPWQGNLTVWPSTHHLVHECLTGKNGAIDCDRMQALLDGKLVRERDAVYESTPVGASYGIAADSGTGGDHNHNASGHVQHVHDNEPSNLPALGPPVQVCLKRGDILFLHPDLAHTGGPNYGPHIRTVLYFRLKSKTNSSTRHWEHVCESHFRDMWSDFSPRVRAAAQQQQLPPRP